MKPQRSKQSDRFRRSKELQEKTKRLAAVEALLKMDKKEEGVIDTDVSDVEAPQKRREYAMARDKIRKF